MPLQENKRYILRFNVNGNDLVFTALITSLENNFVEFIDKYNHSLGYSMDKLISYEEVKDG